MKKQIIICALIMLIGLSSTNCSKQPYLLTKEETSLINNARRISFIEALVYPTRYEGQWITIHGVLKKESSGYVLYQTIPAAKFPNEKEGIWLGDLELNKRLDAMVLIECDCWFVSITGLLSSKYLNYPCGMSDVLLIQKSSILRERDIDYFDKGIDRLGIELCK